MRTMPPWLLWEIPRRSQSCCSARAWRPGGSRSSAWRTAMRVARTLSRGSRGVRMSSRVVIWLSVRQCVGVAITLRCSVDTRPSIQSRRNSREAASQPGSGHETVRRAATPGGVPERETRRRGVGRTSAASATTTRSPRTASSRWRIRPWRSRRDGGRSGPQRRGDFATRQVRQPVGYGPDLVRASAEPRQKSTSPPNAFAPAGGPHRTQDPVSWQNRQHDQGRAVPRQVDPMRRPIAVSELMFDFMTRGSDSLRAPQLRDR